MSVLPIQTVKGRVVFFRKKRKKISALKPLTVWIFAVAISPPKTGNRIKKSCPRFRLLHSNGKTVCTTAAAVVRFCGGSAPAPPTSPKEQNGMEWNGETHAVRRVLITCLEGIDIHNGRPKQK